MFVMHVALQGCLRGEGVAYGSNADTGGHIRYVLELVRAAGAEGSIARQEIVTRAFAEPHLPACHAEPFEAIDDTTRIVRLADGLPRYLRKEDLHLRHASLTEALIAHIDGLDRKPDLLHAHYADAGILASNVRARLGIPYLFTAHSLGRVKRETFGRHARGRTGGNRADLDRRIGFEERAILHASGIIASSRDEADIQYAGYRNCDPGRIAIIVPGCDLKAFDGAARNGRVEAELDRFLRDPGKPVILAIARPVSRKNLARLVEAFGTDDELRARANLVIVAGNRETIDTLEPEYADNIRALFELIDRHDLYGQVAIPKRHLTSDVPALFAYAAATGGVFVNPALNEPFGLTLLEAAASGLPVVATDSGGTNDIVGHCRNGILVDPHDIAAIGRAILDLVCDRARWQLCADNGRKAVGRYDWCVHAQRYAMFARMLAAVDRPAPASSPLLLLVADIDDIETGCVHTSRRFAQWHDGQNEIVFGIATGRNLQSALAILDEAGTPRPRVIVSAAGSEIHYLAENGAVYEADLAWRTLISAGWDRRSIAQAIERSGLVASQGKLEQRRHKLSYRTDTGNSGTARNATVTIERLARTLSDAGHRCRLVHSQNRYLDVLPAAVSKAEAVEHVRLRLGLARDQVIVAGVSADDVEMLAGLPGVIEVLEPDAGGHAVHTEMSHDLAFARADTA